MPKQTQEEETYKLGHYVHKCLYKMNESLIQKDYDSTKGYINEFLRPLDDDSSEVKEIIELINRIYDKRDFAYKKYDEQFKEVGFLEISDSYWDGKKEIDRNCLEDIVLVCWRIARKYNLFDRQEFVSSYEPAE